MDPVALSRLHTFLLLHCAVMYVEEKVDAWSLNITLSVYIVLCSARMCLRHFNLILLPQPTNFSSCLGCVIPQVIPLGHRVNLKRALRFHVLVIVMILSH